MLDENSKKEELIKLLKNDVDCFNKYRNLTNQKIDLGEADLRKADLRKADLRFADLSLWINHVEQNK